MSLLNSIDNKVFLENYWEKKHLFLPKTFKAPIMSLEKDELLNTTLDEDFETRLIIQENNSWEVEYGPLEDLSFKDSAKKWTVFIHNLNLHETFSKDLQKLVSFIPSWLFDDVLCSISTDGSTVGAHFDRYNVFIIQISGSRKWSIQESPTKKFRKNCGIKVLESFTPDVEYILNPGDMIFIPPECGHEGVSIGDSISLSVGFKSLESADILQNYISELIENTEFEYLKTKPKDFGSSSFEVLDTFIENAFSVLNKKLNSKERFKDSFLSFLTKPKVESFLDNEELSLTEFLNEFGKFKLCFVDEIRFLSFQDELWINESRFNITGELRTILIELIDKRQEVTVNDVEAGLHPYLYELYKCNIIGFLD